MFGRVSRYVRSDHNNQCIMTTRKKRPAKAGLIQPLDLKVLLDFYSEGFGAKAGLQLTIVTTIGGSPDRDGSWHTGRTRIFTSRCCTEGQRMNRYHQKRSFCLRLLTLKSWDAACDGKI